MGNVSVEVIDASILLWGVLPSTLQAYDPEKAGVY